MRRSDGRRIAPLLLLACAALWLVLCSIATAAEPQSTAVPAKASGLLAGVPDARIEAGLLTIAPGDIYWQRFGHNAIVLRDRLDPGRLVAVNYGIFDFGEKNFLLNFLRGRMHYFAVAGDPRAEIRDYAASGRGMDLQWLALTPAQAGRLRTRLESDTSPANSRYRYDYFTRNCSTRVRDALDFAFDGALERSARVRSRGWTYRQHSLRLARADLPLALGIHLGLSAYTDRPLTLWQEAFVPQRLADAVAELLIDRAPVVATTQVLAPHSIGLPAAQPPRWRWAFATAGLALAAVFWVLQRSGTRVATSAYGWLRRAVLALAGLVGCGLLALWVGTDHVAAHRNLNILVMSPLCLGWLLGIRSRHQALRLVGQWSIAGVLLSLALALWFAFTGALRQDFADWLLLIAPALIVLARGERAAHAIAATGPSTA